MKNNLASHRFTIMIYGIITSTLMVGVAVYWMFERSLDISSDNISDLRINFGRQLFLCLALISSSAFFIILIEPILIGQPLPKARPFNQIFKRKTKPSKLSDKANNMLDYTEKLISRHNSFSPNLAQALKAPLKIIRNESKSKHIQQQIDLILNIIDNNIVKSPSVSQSSVQQILETIAEHFSKSYNKEIEVICSEDLKIQIDEVDLYETITNLVENACKNANHLIRIEADMNKITVENDGKRKFSKAEQQNNVVLSITKDIIELHKSRLIFSKSKLGGLKASIILPAQNVTVLRNQVISIVSRGPNILEFKKSATS